MADNNLYTVKATDNKVIKGYELVYEFINKNHALQLFNELNKDKEGYTDVFLYEYDFTTNEHHLLKY